MAAVKVLNGWKRGKLIRGVAMLSAAMYVFA